MKIMVFCSWGFFPKFCGTKRIIHNTIQGLTDQGHEVYPVFSISNSKPLEYPVKHKAIRISRIYLFLEFILNKLSFPSKYIRYSWNGLIKVFRGKVLGWSLARPAQKYIDTVKPDLLLVEDFFIMPLSVKLASKNNIPICFRVHHIHSIQHKGQQWLYNKINELEYNHFSKANALIVFTKQDKDFLGNQTDKPIYCSPFGMFKFDFSNNSNYEPSEKYALYVSSYVGEEEPSLRQLAKMFPSLIMYIIGEGTKDITNSPSNIQTLSSISDEHLTMLYSKCKFAFFPLSWAPGQGYPTKLAEAYINNIPILITNNSASLLPEKSSGVETYTNQEEMTEGAENLLNKITPINRSKNPFDIDQTSKDLAYIIEHIVSNFRKNNV